VVPRAPRRAGGFRYYSDETIARLLFVRNAIGFGFRSKELAGFFKARDSGRPPCQSVRAAGQGLVKEMDEHNGPAGANGVLGVYPKPSFTRFNLD
jgi:MerR family transcriptional regulator, copper efflux regulator